MKKQLRLPFSVRAVTIFLFAPAAFFLLITVVVLSEGSNSPEPASDPVVLTDAYGGSLTLTELSCYYWSEYYYLLSDSDSLPDGFDPDLSPAGQVFDEETGETWEDWFVSSALTAAEETLALCHAADEAGFTLSEDYETSLADTMAQFRESAAEAGYVLSDGSSDLDGWLQASYGENADTAMFEHYLRCAYLASAWAEQRCQALSETYSDDDGLYEAWRDEVSSCVYAMGFEVSDDIPAMPVPEGLFAG